MLTTPEPFADSPHDDSVCLGANWFPYWKISRSLWSERLKRFPPGAAIFVPFNWGLHQQLKDQWDFGEARAECDLHFLFNLIKEHQLTGHLAISFGPNPYMVNGGLPPWCVFEMSLNSFGQPLYGAIGNDYFTPLYSWYHNSIIRQFAYAQECVKNYFQKSESPIEIISFENWYFLSGKVYSFFADRGPLFQKKMNHFLTKHSEHHPPSSEIEQKVNWEMGMQAEFHHQFLSWFKETMSEIWNDHYSAHLNVGIIASSPTDNAYQKVTGNPISIAQMGDQFICFLQHNIYPIIDPLLYNLGESQKLKYFKFFNFLHQGLGEYNFFQFSKSMYQTKIAGEIFHLEWNAYLDHQLDEVNSQAILKAWGQFGNIHQIINTAEFGFCTGSCGANFFFYNGRELDLNQLIKLFCDGNHIFLNTDDIDSEKAKKLFLFFLENDLSVQKIQLECELEMVRLGDAYLILYSAAGLQNPEASSVFWNKMATNFEKSSGLLKIPTIEGLLSLWQVRTPIGGELEYLQIRRLQLFNLTSYKKNIDLAPLEGWVFLKLVDPYLTQLKKNSQLQRSFSLEIMPMGSAVLEFGQYE